MVRHLLAGLLMVGACAPHAAATLIYDSFVSPVDSDYYAGVSRTPANSFTAGSEASVLTDVWLRMLVDGDAVGSALVELYEDDAGKPGSLCASLGVLNDSDVTAHPGWSEVHLTPNGIALAADTRYWIALSTTNESALAWLRPLLQSFDGLTGVAGEYNGQGLWGDYSENMPGEGSPYQMRIGTEIVPEPASGLLLALGLGALAVVRRRL